MTQFVRGALPRARRAGVKIVFITYWPGTELQTCVDVVTVPMVGPEVIAGSIRLKTGSATKFVLSMLTTISMVHAGKTCGNLLRRANWNVNVGIVMEATGDTYSSALSGLKKAGQSVRAAISEDVERIPSDSLHDR